jgi:hypothetical protein
MGGAAGVQPSPHTSPYLPAHTHQPTTTTPSPHTHLAVHRSLLVIRVIIVLAAVLKARVAIRARGAGSGRALLALRGASGGRWPVVGVAQRCPALPRCV